MRHQKAGKKLNRTGSHRNAMFRNMVTSLFVHSRIRTTHTKAKELRRWADRMITLAKRGDLHARRQALAVVRDKAVVHRLFEEAPNRFGERAGGYTRVVQIGRRRGDAAPISLIELVTAKESPKGKKKKSKVSQKGVAKTKKEAPAAPDKKEKAAPDKKEKARKTKTAKKAAEQVAPEMKNGTVSEPEGEPSSEEDTAKLEG